MARKDRKGRAGVEHGQEATRQLAEFAARTRFADLPEDVRRMSKNLLLDSLGCALPGQFVEKGRIPLDLVTSLGGTPRCSVVGTRAKSSPVLAAFANGELINALDFDAILAPGHIAPYVIPPALALAEERGASGADLVVAVAIAHEVGCRVAASLAGLRELRGSGTRLHYALSPVSGYGSSTIGAVAGAGSVLGFDAAAMANALGLAGYAAPVPSLTKYLHARHSFHAKYTSSGMVAMAGCLSALMGQAGYGGDDTVLDGPYGFWRMFGSKSCNWEFMLGGLGTEWRMLRAEPKPFPTFRMSHAAIDAFQQLLREHAVNPDEITRMEVTADPVSMADCYMNRQLQNHTDAQLSWPYVVAVAAYYEPGLAWQREGFQDVRVRRLMERITIRRSPDWGAALYQLRRRDASTGEFPVWLRSTVTVEVGGRTLTHQLAGHTKGHPENPMTDKDLDQKFLHNATSVLPADASERALRQLRELDTVGDVRELVAALTP
jgi:2-methylcitrate dehydratase PrpD